MPSFSPEDRPTVVASNDGTLAAIREVGAITVIDLPGGSPLARIEVDLEARAIGLGWLGGPPRLLVLSRYEAHCIARLFEPRTPATIAELWLGTRLRLVATIQSHALVFGTQGAAVLAAGDAGLTAFEWPSSVIPSVAGRGVGRFLVPVGAAIEEWDPRDCSGKRKIPLLDPVDITRLGGNDRVVWMTTQSNAARIEVLSRLIRGPSTAHDIPEPIGEVSGHPQANIIACIGAETGRLYIVDLAGQAPPRAIEVDGIDRVESVDIVVTGTSIAVCAARGGRPVTTIVLHG